MATPGAAIHRDVEQRFRDLEDAVRRLSNPALRIRGTNLVTITPGPGVAVDAEDKLNPIISTSVQAWNQDQGVALEDGSPVVVVLSFYPNENTLHVTQNGEYLLPSEWSLDGNYLTVAPTSVRKILAGDVFAAAYWYDSLAETPPLPLDFTTEVMAVQPALWAGLGDTSGTSAVDSSGNSRTGTYGGTVALGEDALAPGLPGSSVDLLGTGWVEYAPGAAWQRPAAFSAGIWCKPTGASSAYLFCADDASTNDSDRIWNLSAQGAVRVYKSTLMFEALGAAPAADETTFISMTYDGSTLRHYINGAEVANTSAPGPINTSTLWPLTIGATADGGAGRAFKFNGKLQHAVLWDAVLTADNMDRIYRAGMGLP